MNVSVNNSVGNYVVTLLSPLWRIITMELIMSQTRTIKMSIDCESDYGNSPLLEFM